MLRALAFHTLSYAARSSAQSGGIAGLGVALYRRGLSLLTRLALGGMLAAIAAILIGAVATGGGLVQLLVTAFAAFALWIPAFLLVSRIAEWRRRRRIREALSVESRRGRAAGGVAPLAQIDAAWGSLALAVGERRSEVHRIEQQLAAVWRGLPANSLDPQVHELRLLIGRRIPQLIDTQLACLPLSRSRRAAETDSLIELLHEFTSDSVRRYEAIAISRQSDHAIVRQRIEDHLGRDDGLKPLG